MKEVKAKEVKLNMKDPSLKDVLNILRCDNRMRELESEKEMDRLRSNIMRLEEIKPIIKEKSEEIVLALLKLNNLKFEVVRKKEKIIDIQIEDEELNKINPQDLNNKILAILTGCRFFGSNWRGQEELKKRNLFDKYGYICPELEFYFHLSE